MAEQSLASVLRSWMRKVVGSNPDDSLYRTRVYFCYRFGRRLLRDRKTGTAGNDKQMREARGRLNQPSSNLELEVAPSTIIVNIY